MQQQAQQASPPPPPLNLPNVLSALTVLSGGGGGGSGVSSVHIKEAESALLSWESSHPDDYAAALLSVLYSDTSSSTGGGGGDGGSGGVPTRLAAALSLKACVGRRWKDRGRGARPLPRRIAADGTTTSSVSTPPALMSEQTKDVVRCAVLSIIVGMSLPSTGAGAQQPKMPQLSPDLASRLTNDGGIQSACTSQIAKIGRLDLPMKFHTLIPTLVACATDGALEQRRRYNALQALDAVLTELCDKRLLLDKKYVASVVMEHLPLLSDGLESSMDGVGNVLGSNSGVQNYDLAKLTIQYATGMVSVLRRLLRHSLPAAQNSSSGGSKEATDKVYEIVMQSIPALLDIVRRQTNGTDGGGGRVLVDDVGRLLHEMCRIVVDVQKADPIEFGRYLGPFLQLFYHNFVEISGTATAVIVEENSAMGQFIMATMTFLSNVLGCSKYEPDECTNEAIDTIRERSTNNADGTKRTITSTGDTFATPSTLSAIEHAVQMVSGYFTTPRTEQLADLTIQHHMVLSRGRLEEWNNDPEAYFHAEASRTSEDDINACAQALYLSLVESKLGKSVVTPRIVAMLKDLDGQAAAARAEAEGAASAVSQRHVLLLDAVYTAAGISLTALEDGAGFSFATFFDEYLLPCLEMLIREQKETSNLPILRHRIVWLIATNTYSVPVASRSRLYEAILTVIVDDQSRQNDIVIKLTAAQVLNNSLFDRDESLLIFTEHSDSIISALYRLAGICEEYDSRSLVFSCVSFVLTYLVGCGTMKESTANAAVGPLAQIWEESVDQNALLKRDVMSILSSIAQAVGCELSTQLHPIALPMIDVSLDPSQREDNLFLAEDALGLWLSLLRLSPVYSEPLGALIPRAQSLLADDLEHVKVLMMITECYILLGGPTFLNTYASPLQGVLVRVIGHVRPRGAAYAALVLEALMRKFPVEGGRVLLQAGVLKVMLESCAAFYNEDENSEPDRVVALYLTTVARALIASPRILDGSFESVGDAAAFGPSELIQLYLHFCNAEVSDVLPKRLWALVMLALLPPTESLYGKAVVKNLEKLQTICSCEIGLEKSATAIPPYEVGYDYEDEDIFVAGIHSYKALLNKQHTQDVALTTNFHQACIEILEPLLAKMMR